MEKITDFLNPPSSHKTTTQKPTWNFLTFRSLLFFLRTNGNPPPPEIGVFYPTPSPPKKSNFHLLSTKNQNPNRAWISNFKKGRISPKIANYYRPLFHLFLRIISLFFIFCVFPDKHGYMDNRAQFEGKCDLFKIGKSGAIWHFFCIITKHLIFLGWVG